MRPEQACVKHGFDKEALPGWKGASQHRDEPASTGPEITAGFAARLKDRDLIVLWSGLPVPPLVAGGFCASIRRVKMPAWRELTGALRGTSAGRAAVPRLLPPLLKPVVTMVPQDRTPCPPLT